MEEVDVLFFNWNQAGVHNGDESTNIAVVNYLSTLGLPWIVPGKVCIDKIEDGNALMIYDGRVSDEPGNNITLRLNPNKTKAILDMGNGKTREYNVKGNNIFIKGYPLSVNFDMPTDSAVRMLVAVVNPEGIQKTIPLQTFTKLPSEKEAWNKLKNYITVTNNNRKSRSLPEIICDDNELKLIMNSTLASIAGTYGNIQSERKEHNKKYQQYQQQYNQQQSQKQAKEHINCPKCFHAADLDEEKNNYKCCSCGNEFDPTKPSKEIIKEKFTPDVEDEAKKIVEEGRLMDFFVSTVSKYHFGDDNIKRHSLASHVSKFIRGEKLKHNAATGESASGKSSCMMKCFHALPVHQRLLFGSVTEKALYYYCRDDPAALKWKTVYIDEVNPKLYDALKSLTNPDGVETSWLTVDNGYAVNLNPEKPFNVWVSAVQTFTEVEMRNRFDYPESDDDKAKKDDVDFRIIQAKARNQLWSNDKLKDDSDYKVCRAAIQYLTETKKVNGCIIPDEFIQLIAEITQLANRNDKIGFMALCDDIAYINVCKRQLTPNNEIIVQKEDIELAKSIWGDTSAKLSATERNILKLFEREPEEVEDERQGLMIVTFNELKQRDIERYLTQFYMKQVSASTVSRSLHNLVEKGFIDKHGGGQGVAATYTLAGIRNTNSSGNGNGITLKQAFDRFLEENKFLFSDIIEGNPKPEHIEEVIKMLRMPGGYDISGDKSDNAIRNIINEYCASVKARECNRFC